jgi:LysM repeat protein
VAFIGVSSGMMTAPLEDSAGPDGAPAAGLCPFLRSRDGAWTSSHASRDLRCWAVHPGAQPAIAKQRALCLRSAHAGCATYVAASAHEPGFPLPAPDAAHIWPATRTVPVALEPVRGHRALPVTAPRSGGQALLVGLMVVAFLVLVIARTSVPGASTGAPGATASGSPVSTSPVAAASAPAVVGVPASAGPAASTAGASPSPAASSTPPPSARPSASTVAKSSPAASGSRTYTVRSKDTLSSIAARFHTTVAALATANGITNTRIIRVGQVLVVP